MDISLAVSGLLLLSVPRGMQPLRQLFATTGDGVHSCDGIGEPERAAATTRSAFQTLPPSPPSLPRELALQATVMAKLLHALSRFSSQRRASTSTSGGSVSQQISSPLTDAAPQVRHTAMGVLSCSVREEELVNTMAAFEQEARDAFHLRRGSKADQRSRLDVNGAMGLLRRIWTQWRPGCSFVAKRPHRLAPGVGNKLWTLQFQGGIVEASAACTLMPTSQTHGSRSVALSQ